MQSDNKKKFGSKIKSLVSDYQNSDEEHDGDDAMSTGGEEENGEISGDESNSRGSREDNKHVQLVSNVSATTDELNEHNLEDNRFNNEDNLKEPFQAYKLTPENGFLPGSENIKLPLAPREPCSKELQDKIIQVRKKMIENNYNLNEEIQNKKAFKNPSIYEKFIEHYNLDEFGSSFPSYIKDLKSEGYIFYDELDINQRREWKEKEKEKEKKEKSKVEVVIGTRKPRV